MFWLMFSCSPCPEGFELNSEGACHQTFSEYVDLKDEDTEEPVPELVALNGNCDEITAASDPVQEIGTSFAQDYVFAELLDIEHDKSRDIVWAVGQGGLLYFDVSDPQNPLYLGAPPLLNFPSRAYHLHVASEERLFLSHREFGFSYYDISDLENLSQGEMLNVSGAAGMDSADAYLYVATHEGTIATYDISGPVPTYTSQQSELGNLWTVRVHQSYLYAADNRGQVVVLSRSNPDSPVYLRSVSASGGVQDIVLSEDQSTLYAASGTAGVDVFSLADPAAPQKIHTIPMPYPAISVAVDEGILWVASQQDVIAIDIGDPREPFVINTQKTEQWAMAIEAANGYAFAADWGYMTVFAADSRIEQPDFDPGSTRFYLAENETAKIPLRNFGAAELEIYGGRSSNPNVLGWFEGMSIAAESERYLHLTSTGGETASSICISTSDPDEPVQYIQVMGTQEEPIGYPAPDFSLEGLDGQIYRLSEQYGKPVVLIYFATW